MCYQEYTHFGACEKHIAMHIHICPKNLTESPSRVIFCEDYEIFRIYLDKICNYCQVEEAANDYETVPDTDHLRSQREGARHRSSILPNQYNPRYPQHTMLQRRFAPHWQHKVDDSPLDVWRVGAPAPPAAPAGAQR